MNGLNNKMTSNIENVLSRPRANNYYVQVELYAIFQNFITNIMIKR